MLELTAGCIYIFYFKKPMSPNFVLSIISVYFSFLLLIAYVTSRKADTQDFFIAHKQSPWFLVAFGMIGATLSGVTFISIPGAVFNNKFAYFQLTLGYIVGYTVIGTILLPLYYRMNLVSIYGYLEKRFGFWSYKIGAGYFLISRIIGTSFRLFLAVMVLQEGLFNAWGLPFWLSASITIALIWIYTFRGGIKTIIWTDTFQTTFLLLSLVSSVVLIQSSLNLSLSGLFNVIFQSEYSQIFFWEVNDARNFFKQFLAGAFIAIVMTGLDQDMMQKNLTCRNIKDAQKNMFWFTTILVIAKFIFLCLGALMYIYAAQKGIQLPNKEGVILTDKVFPFLAFNHFGTFAGVCFLLGITAATYASSDSALTAMTTSFCIDFLNVGKKDEAQSKGIVRRVHLGFSALLVGVIVIFKAIADAYPESNVIGSLFTAAGYTYGPLLGLFTFGLFTKMTLNDKWVPLVCILAPVLSFILNANSKAWFNGYEIGFEILLYNGFFTFLGLWMIRKKEIYNEANH